jgi:hypothetical protein
VVSHHELNVPIAQLETKIQLQAIVRKNQRHAITKVSMADQAAAGNSEYS